MSEDNEKKNLTVGGVSGSKKMRLGRVHKKKSEEAGDTPVEEVVETVETVPAPEAEVKSAKKAASKKTAEEDKEKVEEKKPAKKTSSKKQAEEETTEDEYEEEDKIVQLDLFTNYEEEVKKDKKQKKKLAKEKDMQKAIIKIKNKFGKNAVLKGNNLEEGATARERNESVGGHKA